MALTVTAFAIWKLATLEFRFGDENVYFYMSETILRGVLPHRDFFLADPPFFPLLFALWKFLIGDNFILFKVWPIIFDSLSAVLIYLILRSRGVGLAALGPVIYLFSFTVLSTSDYVTGGESMIFFMLLALYLDTLGKHMWSGATWALSCLAKLYAAPALIGFLAYKLFKKQHPELKRVIIGGAVTTAIVLTPFILIAGRELLDNLILHQFNRPPGLNKWNVLGFFAQTEWLLIVTGLAGATLTKQKDLLLPLGASMLFFLWYQDLYFLYLHLLIPFLVIMATELVDNLGKRTPDLAWGYIGLYIFLSIYPVFSYTSTFQTQGVFENPAEVAQVLKQLPDDYPVFGAQEVAPLVALMAERDIFENVIDSNTQSFASGAHNRDELSRAAAREGFYLVARIADYPEHNIQDFGFDRYFDPQVFKSSCTLFRSFDRASTLDQLNKVNIYKCYNSRL